VVDCVFSPQDNRDDDRFVPVGSPHPGVSLRIVDALGVVLPEGTTGRLQAAGLPISPGYYGNPEQNRQSFTEDGWFKTGDLAYIADGVLTVVGRADDVIELAGVTCYGHEIEASVEELPFVEPSYTVACAVTGEKDVAEGLAIFFHPRSGVPSDSENWQIVAHVANRFGVQATYVLPVSKEDVPKTGIGKLKRAQLAKNLGRTGIASVSRS
jgi:acyl-CoA synthetase (AMP-forming)/AMP-acid ligase II